MNIPTQALSCYLQSLLLSREQWCPQVPGPVAACHLYLSICPSLGHLKVVAHGNNVLYSQNLPRDP